MRFANFICETNAACTVNASLCIQDDAGTETHSFRPVYLFNFKTAAFRPIFVGLNLEWTLACLITDRAVQRVVDQQKFQRVFLGTSHLFVGLLRVDHHSIDHLQVAGGLQFWKPPDGPISFFIKLVLSGFSVFHILTRFNKALPAVRRGRHRRVVAKKRNFFSEILNELKNSVFTFKFVSLAIYKYFGHRMKRYLEFIDKSFRYLQQLCHSKDRFFASGFEFIPETGNGMSNRPGCSICKSTNCASFHLGRDIKE